MKVAPQCNVIGPYNYDRIINNIEKNYAKRQDIGQTNGDLRCLILNAFNFKNKKLCNSLKLTFPNTLKVKHLAS